MSEKSYKLRILPLFEEDLNEIVDYITLKLRNPVAAEALVDFELRIRIPGTAARAFVNNRAAGPGTVFSLKRRWQGETRIDLHLEFAVTLEKRPREMYCVKRGPLLFSLPVAAEAKT